MSAKKKILKNTVLLGGWQLVAKVFGLVNFSIITNFLEPAVFGALSIVLNLLDFLYVFYGGVVGGITKYLSENHNRSVLTKGVKYTLVVTILLSLILFFFSDFISDLYGGGITLYLKILALLFVFNGLFEIVKVVFIAMKKINFYVLVGFILVVLRIGLVFLFLYFGWQVVGVLSSMILTLVLVLVLSYFLIKKLKFISSHFESKRLFGYAGKCTGVLIITKTYALIPFLFLSRLATVADAGYYGFIMTIAVFPVIVLPSALQLIVFPYFSDLSANGNNIALEKIINSSIRLATYSSLIAGFGLILFSGVIFNFLFTKYAAAQSLLILGVVLGVVTSLSIIIGSFMRATDNLDITITTGTINLIIFAVLSWFLIPLWGVSGVLVPYILVSFMITVLNIVLVFKRMKLSFSLDLKHDFAFGREIFGILLAKFK